MLQLLKGGKYIGIEPLAFLLIIPVNIEVLGFAVRSFLVKEAGIHPELTIFEP